MNRLQIKFMVFKLKFCSSCYMRLLAAPAKSWEHLRKAATILSPVWSFNFLCLNPKIDILFFSPRLLSVRCVCQTFVNDVPHGHESFTHICHVIIGTGHVGGRLAWAKACYTLTRSLTCKKEERKEKKWTQSEFLLFPSLFFSFSPSKLMKTHVDRVIPELVFSPVQVLPRLRVFLLVC